MIMFEDIIGEKDKTKRDALIKEKLFKLNEEYEPINITVNTNVTGFISNKSILCFSNFHYDLDKGLGSFYGMKATDYFYDFFDFLIEHNLNTKQDVIKYISLFLKIYFDENGFKKIDREVFYDDVCNQLSAMYDDKERFNICKEQWMDIGIFKNMSSAECTEYSCITQNLLTFCDIECCYIPGHMKSATADGDHAFNIFKTKDSYFLLDSTNPYCLFDSNNNYVTCRTYFYKVPYEQVIDFFNNNGEISIPKCNYLEKEGGKCIIVDKSFNKYSTTSKPINLDDLNAFCDINKKVL